jgi:hypothetical protein
MVAGTADSKAAFCPPSRPRAEQANPARAPSTQTPIPPPPPDLDCPDINGSNFTVQGTDPHGFDADNDGVGCES